MSCQKHQSRIGGKKASINKKSDIEILKSDKDDHGWSKFDKLKLIEAMQLHDSRNIKGLSKYTKFPEKQIRNYFNRLKPCNRSNSVSAQKGMKLVHWDKSIGFKNLKHYDYSDSIAKIFNMIQVFEAKTIKKLNSVEDPGVDWASIYGFFTDVLMEKPIRNLKLLETKLVLDVIEELNVYSKCFDINSEELKKCTENLIDKIGYELKNTRRFCHDVNTEKLFKDIKEPIIDPLHNSLNPLNLSNNCITTKNETNVQEYLKNYQTNKNMELVNSWPYVHNLEFFKKLRNKSEKHRKLYQQLDKTLQNDTEEYQLMDNESNYQESMGLMNEVFENFNEKSNTVIERIDNAVSMKSLESAQFDIELCEKHQENEDNNEYIVEECDDEDDLQYWEDDGEDDN